MRILFDQGTPVPLRSEFSGHKVATVYEVGWDRLSNGELLREAESKYDLLITTDQNLRHQQNLTGRQLAILVLPTANWPRLRSHAQMIVAAALAMQPGEYQEIVLPA
jgi:predicted nuclease of predicted toxin-antitoxin system